MNNVLKDIPPSFVVFLIALPLSMGIAIASGVPPAVGLVSAVVGGLVVGLLGGAPLQVTGPAAGLTVLVMQMMETHGAPVFGLIVILAGGIQIAAGLLKVGRQFQAVSPAVMRGMMAGIGVLIILSQVHVMLDNDIPGSGLDNFTAIPEVLWRTVTNHNDMLHDEAALIGVLTLVIVVLWERYKPTRFKPIPGPLLGVSFAVILASLLELPIRYVAVPENLTELVTIPTPAVFGHLLDISVWMAAVALAFVASAATLLCASAVARMHDRGRTNYDRELAVQGIANVICGLLGALPLTGVISRSTVNVQSGARTRWSAILHAVWISVFVIFMPELLAMVPTSSLAAILVYVGFALINFKEIKKLSRFGRPVLAILIVTILGVVFIDLLKGIILGFSLSAGHLMVVMSKVDFILDKRPDPDGDGPVKERWDFRISGSATFLSLPKLQDVLDTVKPGIEIHVCFEQLNFIDHACLDSLDEFRKRHEASGGEFVVEWDQLFKMHVAPQSTNLPDSID